MEIQEDWKGVGHGITVQGNALAAFAKVGVLDALLARGVPFDALRMRRADGTLIAELRTPRTGGEALPATMGALRSDIQGAAMCAEDGVVLAELVTGELPVGRALPAFMARRMPRVEIVVRNSMQLVRYEMGTDPHTDEDVAYAMSSTLDFLAAAEA